MTDDYIEIAGLLPPDAHEQVKAIYAYWLSKHDGEKIPDRRALDPVIEIPRLLADVWLMDVEHDPRRYRFRLAGANLMKATNHPEIGTYMDEMEDAEDLAEIFVAMDRVCNTHRPVWRRGTPIITQDRYLPTIEVIMLPLRRDGSDETRMLFNLSIYHWRGAGNEEPAK